MPNGFLEDINRIKDEKEKLKTRIDGYAVCCTDIIKSLTFDSNFDISYRIKENNYDNYEISIFIYKNFPNYTKELVWTGSIKFYLEGTSYIDNKDNSHFDFYKWIERAKKAMEEYTK